MLLCLIMYTLPDSCELNKTSNSSSKTRGLPPPHTQITCAYFLGSEEPSLKLLRSAKLQHTNSSGSP